MPEEHLEIRPPEWFQMPEIRRRRLTTAVWIPLRQSETLVTGGTNLKPGFYEETLCVGSLAVYADQREAGDRLSWDDIGLIHDPGPYAFSDGRYKPADQYHYHDDGPAIGVELVILNRLNSNHNTEWLINQDLIVALRLLLEGDSWVRPDEGYIEVIRQRRNAENRVVAIEIRAEHLRDYLCARRLALRLVQYRQRLQVVADASHIPWQGTVVPEAAANERFELRTFSIGEDGGLPGRVAVMKIWRNDVDHDVDVPEFGPESDSNTDYDSYEFERAGPTVEQVEGELWRDEWVEPAERSERVRGDAPTEQLFYSTGAAGEKKPANELNYEEIGLYLWFKAEVIESLLSHRGSGLCWYTANTGSVKCSPDYEVHFGINESCHINVYAFDIARLPQWQQRIWHGFNISPDGPPSRELQSAQLCCQPAATEAPENDFRMLLEKLNAFFMTSFGAPLFKPHDHAQEILHQCHRFRALRENGVLALAKDIARLTADSIDIGLLRKHVALDPKENLKGLKLLERLVQEYSDKETAYQIMGPLHIAYGLRLGDAHLPSKEGIEKAFAELKAPQDAHPLIVGTVLLERVCASLSSIGQATSHGIQAKQANVSGNTVDQ